MADAINNSATTNSKLPHGAMTAAILKWNAGMGVTPFGGNSGPDAASILLLKAHAVIECLRAAHESADQNSECEFALLNEDYKSLALDAVGDIVLFAKMLVDEA